MSSVHENGDSFTNPSYSRADETLTGVLLGVFCDFMEGDFQMLRTFLRATRFQRLSSVTIAHHMLNFAGAMNDINPALNVRDDTIESLVGTFVRLREILLSMSLITIPVLHIE